MKELNCVAIAGVGLIGGSLGLALGSRNLARSIVGFGSRAATLETAWRRGAITEIATDAKSAVAEADLVVLCAPVAHITALARTINPHCRPGTLITDVGSTKRDIVHDLDAALADPSWNPLVRFVGSHPLAGNEKSGPEHATADLFVDRTVVVTPSKNTQAEDLRGVVDFWKALGAKVREMSPDEHDRAVAATSHLPHLVAAAIAGSTPEQYVSLTGSGWQDTTRIAAGDPVLWRQIMLANRDNLSASLEQFSARLVQWQQALAAGDSVELDRLLSEAKRIRDTVDK
jgi:prephenate dehydrogenase